MPINRVLSAQRWFGPAALASIGIYEPQELGFPSSFFSRSTEWAAGERAIYHRKTVRVFLRTAEASGLTQLASDKFTERLRCRRPRLGD